MKKKELKNKINNQKEMINCLMFENSELQNKVKAFEKIETHYQSHLDIAENEIKRLNTIINYYETK